MAIVKVSPKFQVVIPKEIRDSLEIKQGEELQMLVLDGSIRLHRQRSIRDLLGAARGVKWKDDYRDRSDRF
jgi:AbrB family looped-hinge helix DNA binding protein